MSDAKEQEWIDAVKEAERKLVEAYRKQDEDRKSVEAHCNCVEARCKRVEARCKLRKYRKSKARPGKRVEVSR